MDVRTEILAADVLEESGLFHDGAWLFACAAEDDCASRLADAITDYFAGSPPLRAVISSRSRRI